MGDIICLSDHARASKTVSREAKEVSSSAVTPAAAAFSVASNEAHHSAGMLSRCHHFDTAEAVAPISAAIASRAPQASLAPHNSITDRKDEICDMPQTLGQTVLKRKDFLSLDGSRPLGHTVRMAESDEESLYKQEFMARVKHARVARGWKQWQAADAMGIPQDKYKQYEGRSLMPHYLIGRFCLVCLVDPQWLLTGHGDRAPKPIRVVTESEPAPKPKQKRTRSRRAA